VLRQIDLKAELYRAISDIVFSDCPHCSKIRTPHELCQEVVDLLDFNKEIDENGNERKKQVLVMWNPEFLTSILNDVGPDAVDITFITGSKKVSELKIEGVKQIVYANPFDIEEVERVTKNL
jgi:ribosomal protein L32